MMSTSEFKLIQQFIQKKINVLISIDLWIIKKIKQIRENRKSKKEQQNTHHTINNQTISYHYLYKAYKTAKAIEKPTPRSEDTTYEWSISVDAM